MDFKKAGRSKVATLYLSRELVITSECSPMVTGSNTSGMILACGNIADITLDTRYSALGHQLN